MDRIKDLINGSKTSLKELIKCRKELESMRKDLESMQTEIDWNLKVAAEINEALKKVKQEMRFVNAEFVGVRCEAEETLKFFQDVEKSFHDFQHCLDSLFLKPLCHAHWGNFKENNKFESTWNKRQPEQTNIPAVHKQQFEPT